MTKLAAIIEVDVILGLGLKLTSSFQTQVPYSPHYLYNDYLWTKYLASTLILFSLTSALLGMFFEKKWAEPFSFALLILGIVSALGNNTIGLLLALK